MICCCSMAGTTACRTCNRRAEFEYPQYVIDYVKTDPMYLQKDSIRITELEHAIERLNERIDEVLGEQDENYKNKQKDK